MNRWTRDTETNQTVGRITADEARALVLEKRKAAQRETEIEAIRYHGMVAQRIFEAAQNGETELHYLFGDIPTVSRLPVIRRLQEDGFEVHDDPMGGVVFWPPLRCDPIDEDEALASPPEPLLLSGAAASVTTGDV